MAVPFALRVSTADSASRRPSLKMTGACSDAIRNLQTTIYRADIHRLLTRSKKVSNLRPTLDNQNFL